MQRKILWWTIFIVVTVNLAIVVAVVVGARNPDRAAAMPDPNGYDDLLKAAESIATPPGDADELSQDQLRTVVAENSDALKLARVGLERDSRVPVEYSTESVSKRMQQFGNLKQLGRLFRVEAKLAEAEGKTNEAAGIWLDLVQFGGALGRGGLLIDGMVAISFETLGTRGLSRIVGDLGKEAAHAALSRVAELEKKRDSGESIVSYERAWARRTGGVTGAVYRFVSMFTGDKMKPAIQKFLAADAQVVREMRRLRVQLAARIYEIEKGQSPVSASELVPAYLDAVPTDPVSGSTMTLDG